MGRRLSKGVWGEERRRRLAAPNVPPGAEPRVLEDPNHDAGTPG
ncbi:MAG TPA: hypothetical protein PK156_39635 [Polyangium sp.]|nr:hypothetical protein [Polyangium sp.]